MPVDGAAALPEKGRGSPGDAKGFAGPQGVTDATHHHPGPILLWRIVLRKRQYPSSGRNARGGRTDIDVVIIFEANREIRRPLVGMFLRFDGA